MKTCIICKKPATKHNRTSFIVVYGLVGTLAPDSQIGYEMGNVCKACRDANTKPGDWTRFDLRIIRQTKIVLAHL